MKEKITITIPNPLFWLYSFIPKQCTHEEWDMDTQIRTIKCRKCKKMAWVKEYKNLYEADFLEANK